MDQLSRKNIFFNIAQIGLKPISDAASRRELSESVFKVEKGALCAELRVILLQDYNFGANVNIIW